MKGSIVGLRLRLRAVIAGEVTTLGAAVALLGVGVEPVYALVAAALVAVCGCLVTFTGLASWQWVMLALRWGGHREHKIAVSDDIIDVEVDGTTVGVLIDGRTVITTISVWGKPYMPTLLRPRGAETPNTLPLTVIAREMHRVGLGVDVDVICEGRRTAADNYAVLYATFLRGRAAAGRRTTTLVLRMDTRAADTIGGLLWRRNTAEAAAAATLRMARALEQVNCRTQILSAAQMRQAAITGVGGPDAIAETFRDQWTGLHRSGHGYVTSYYFSSEDIQSAALDDVWSYSAEHTALVLALRRDGSTVRASAVVRLSTAQPLPTAPALILNRYTGRQWAAVADTLPGRARLTGLPSAPVTADLDSAVVVGPSGVMIGRIGDGLLLMPLSDPAAPTRIAMNTDDDVAVRQLIRRAAAAGEWVAVYDDTDRWTMTAGSSRIWTTRDMTAQPPRPPTLVVHNGRANPYPGAWASVSVGASQTGDPDTVIKGLLEGGASVAVDQRGTEIRLGTERFSTTVEAVTFRNEQTYLN